MKTFRKLVTAGAIVAICLSMTGCDDVRVYGSVGYSGYNGYGGYHGSPGYGSSIRVGGRLY
jgi:hypothetical protein